MVSFLSLFLSFFFNWTSLPFQAIQATFRAEEMVNYSHQKMKEEKGRRIVAVDAFHLVEKSIQELKSKLTEEERERKSVAVALDITERQAEGQWVLFHNAEDQLVTLKEQIIALKKKLEEAEKTKDQAKKAREETEQQGYDIGVAEIEEAMTLLTVSAYPFPCGYAEVEYLFVIPRS